MHRIIVWIVAMATVAASCAGSTTNDPSSDLDVPTLDVDATTRSLDSGAARVLLTDQIADIDAAIMLWRSAATVEEALTAAEGAANLVVGPNGPGYGDRNGDGIVSGETDDGVLPGLNGAPAGLAAALESNDCIVADVLGGSWSDPRDRWDEMISAIDRWRPDNNTMPSLASHPMRIVGWASFSMESASLEEIQTYAGHANIHVTVSSRALDC